MSKQKYMPKPRMSPSSPRPSTPATELLRRDLAGYMCLIAIIGSVPMIDWVLIGGSELANNARLAYFTTVAIGTVYLGSQRQDLGETSPISGKSAALAPIVASTVLGGLYILIKYTGLNPGVVYQFFACLFALLAMSDLLQPLFGLLTAGELLTPATEAFGEKQESEIMNAGAVPAFVVALALVCTYLQGPVSTGGSLPLPMFAAVNNCLGWGITMTSLGVLALESFAAAALLLLGLFFYDAFFVFKSDIMLTVATQIEAPAKFLFAAMREAGDDRYPFSVLGLGDVVVPGAFVSLMREVDKDGLSRMGDVSLNVSIPNFDRVGIFDTSPYFYAGLGGYTFGLLATFVANYITNAGQPALVYIVPSLLIAAGATGLAQGELKELLEYRSKRAAAAIKDSKVWKAARDAEKKV
eukprot:CAMPEP_0119315888 /NCGR_PEP_ID=MMETSP1333-20130426/37576_1 /TAXON_ID=418940 /ORGANISM="Scyphosphaera apsteinii, Strain RCC1455" /LENGTH=411 /DNA_ID=CAMNT_0007321383 /DNA_START=187 /DNA_END=1422 /DNA_ORIENTATION=+